MSDIAISDLTALGAAPASNDLLPLVDVSDTTQAPTGTTKKMTVANLFTAPALTGTTTAVKITNNGAASFGSALAATAFQLYADATYGAALAGFGTTADTTLLDRGGTPRVQVTSALTTVNNSTTIMAGTATLTLASSTTADAYFAITGANTQKNFRIGKSIATSNALEIQASASNGGSDYATIFTLQNTGDLSTGRNLNVAGSLAVSATSNNVTLNVQQASAGTYGLLTFQRSGIQKAALALDAGDSFSMYNSAAGTVNWSWTDAGAFSIRNGLTVAAGGVTVSGLATITRGGTPLQLVDSTAGGTASSSIQVIRGATTAGYVGTDASNNFVIQRADGTSAIAVDRSTGVVTLGSNLSIPNGQLTVTAASAEPIMAVQRTGSGAQQWSWRVDSSGSGYLRNDTSPFAALVATTSNVLLTGGATQTTGASTGDLIHPNGHGPRSVTAAGSSTNTMMFVDGSDILTFYANSKALHITFPSTRTTIGANGSATALTANPVGYLDILLQGVSYQIPYYTRGA